MTPGGLHCPACGKPVDHVDMKVLAEARLTPQQRVIVNDLVVAYPRYRTRDQIFATMYAFDPNGGPENVSNAVAVRMTNIRKKLSGTGWTVSHSKGGLGHYGSYRLCPLSDMDGEKG